MRISLAWNNRLSPWFVAFGLFFLGLTSPTEALKHPYFSKHPNEEKRLEELLRNAQIQALELQPADLSVPLQNLQGESVDLSKQRGNVLLLSRWATWCGACKQEMPFKTALHQKINNPRFKVVGISDEDASTVKQFEATNETPYKAMSLLDPNQHTQKFFPGGAIPVTVLIDGWGWVIGVRKGGAQWNAAPVQKLIRFLLQHMPTKAALQEKAPAPQVRYSGTQRIQVNQVARVTFALTWNGEHDKYARVAFRLPKHKQVQLLGMETTSIETNQQGNHRRYVLRFKVTKAGEYDLNPILMNYWLKDYDQHFQKNVGRLVLEASTAIAPRKSIPFWAYPVLGLSVLLLGLLFFLASRAKQQTENQTEDDQALSLRQTLEAHINQAVEAHRQGNMADFLGALGTIHTTLQGPKNDELRELIEKVRYGGDPLPEEERRKHIQQTRELLEKEHPELAPQIAQLGL